MPEDDATGERDAWGCVVGRFQPFHRDHCSLVEEVVAASGRVIVAVTNVEASWRVPVREAPHRHEEAANPFTYGQRVELIEAALAPFVPREQFRVTPFPIHDPTQWGEYLPPGTECWVRDRGPWEQRKIRDLGMHYPVRVASPLDVEVSGTEIRRRLRAGDESWTADVPEPVAELIRRWRCDGTFQ